MLELNRILKHKQAHKWNDRCAVINFQYNKNGMQTDEQLYYAIFGSGTKNSHQKRIKQRSECNEYANEIE